MTLNYQITLADLQESFAPELPPGQQRKPNRPALPLWTTWLLAFLLGGILIVIDIHYNHPPRGVTYPEDDLLLTLVPTLAPALCILSYALYAVAYSSSTPNPANPDISTRRRKLAQAYSGAFYTILGLTLLYLRSPFTFRWRPAPGDRLALSLIPWAIVLAAIHALFKRLQSHQIGHLWSTWRSLHAPHTLDASPDALTITTDSLTTRYRWLHFTTFRETPNLFVLTSRDEELYILPKRAFPDDPSLHLFRGLLQSSIPTGSTLPQPSAFPVLPIPEQK